MASNIQQLRTTFKDLLPQLVRPGVTHKSKNEFLLQLIRLSEVKILRKFLT
jgi:hypothetical protein